MTKKRFLNKMAVFETKNEINFCFAAIFMKSLDVVICPSLDFLEYRCGQRGKGNCISLPVPALLLSNACSLPISMFLDINTVTLLLR